MNMTKRRFLGGAAATFGSSLVGGFQFNQAVAASKGAVINPRSGFCSAGDWDRAYENRWGLLGTHSRSQIEFIVHADNGVYDDSEGVFAWIAHYWLRAWAQMADWTGDEKYLHAGMSFINYMLAHTDAERIARGEIVENYLREPAGLQGTGRGGPFWKRWEEVNALNTGQVTHGILRFVDTVLENEDRWPAYVPIVENYFEAARKAVDSFDSDWRDFGDAGSYFYRDSGGTNVLGSTQTAFNQSATMCSAQLLLNKWDPNPVRVEKARRLANSWVNDFAEFQSDGTVRWPYILVEHLRHVEDTGHASVDLDFLLLAHKQGIEEISTQHVDALVKTFKTKIWNRDGTLNRFLDGTTRPGYKEHFNAGFGWFELARYDPEILTMALKTYETHYPENSANGIIWARPMLGWANILAQSTGC